jgi:DNA-directed RNA polymerase subunit RPC12/RpoP
MDFHLMRSISVQEWWDMYFCGSSCARCKNKLLRVVIDRVLTDPNDPWHILCPSCGSRLHSIGRLDITIEC